MVQLNMDPVTELDRRVGRELNELKIHLDMVKEQLIQLQYDFDNAITAMKATIAGQNDTLRQLQEAVS